MWYSKANITRRGGERRGEAWQQKKRRISPDSKLPTPWTHCSASSVFTEYNGDTQQRRLYVPCAPAGQHPPVTTEITNRGRNFSRVDSFFFFPFRLQWFTNRPVVSIHWIPTHYFATRPTKNGPLNGQRSICTNAFTNALLKRRKKCSTLLHNQR